MPAGRDDMKFYVDIGRIASASERIANALEILAVAHSETNPSPNAKTKVVHRLDNIKEVPPK